MKKQSLKYLIQFSICLVCALMINLDGFSQSDSLQTGNSSTLLKQISEINNIPDSLKEVQTPRENILPDSTNNFSDTTNLNTSDTLSVNGTNSDIQNTPQRKSEEVLTTTVFSKAVDSITIDMKTKKAYMYKGVNILYDGIDLKSGFVEVDFKKNELFAQGIPDSLGNESETPLFNDGSAEFRSKEMGFNFKTKKGLIKSVITQEGEGFLHGEKVKKIDDEINYVSHGSYTTCDLDHPHFEFRFNKAKTTRNKLITGPIVPVIADVPLYPIVLPFAYLPKQNGQRSGILIPTYGESADRGFFFENGGYYFGINDYVDLELRGDIYTRGSWALKPSMRYKVRYKYSGNFGISYAVNKFSNDTDRKDFSIRWTHTQDPKARPNSKFSANVNIKSSKFNELNPENSDDFLTNTYTSSVTYQTKLFNSLNFTAKAGHSQNTKTGVVDINLPTISLSANRFYPFKRKKQIGGERWYEKISVNYSMNAENGVKTQDTLLNAQYINQVLKDFENGMKHNVSVQHSTKLLKYVNMTLSGKYTERWYSRRTEKDWVNDTIWLDDEEFMFDEVISDTSYGFYQVRDFSTSASLNTTIYGVKEFAKGPLRAVRHVMKPNVSLSYRPDFAGALWGYYDTYTDLEGTETEYSYYRNNAYGTAPSGKSGNVNFSLGNNLEIKVRDRSDTVTGSKKIKLIESLSFSTAYNMAKDSVRWSKLKISGRTSVFKNQIKINFGATYDPYVLDTNRHQTNTFEWDANRRLFHKDNLNWGLNFGYRLSSKQFKEMLNPDSRKKKKNKEGKEGEAEGEEIKPDIPPELARRRPGGPIKWANDWSLGFDYSLKYTDLYSTSLERFEQKFVQTLGFTGKVDLTEKWKVSLRSGYDFEAKEISYTSINIDRDLHCWTMSFSWIPSGLRKSWSFTIRAKSTLLQDLKLERKKDPRDSY